ncbi:MAG TPA: hypothetical protein QGF58_25365 [Myxococcota bacterium]|nr:hypothetical protein [Myxococcota bacterium]
MWVVGVRGAFAGVPGELCRFSVPGAEGVVISIPRMPAFLLENQDEAQRMMAEAVAGLEVDAVGLGSLLAVVAGRGESLAAEVDVPVTIGAAATSWAAIENTLAVCAGLGVEEVAVLGFSSAVGHAVAVSLKDAGLSVVAGGRGAALVRRAEALGLPCVDDAVAVAGKRVVVGAATTGGTLDGMALEPNTVLLDVALPPTLRPGPRAAGVRVLAAEAVELPEGWAKGFWGAIYHVVSGYGPSQVYACLLEPMVLAMSGRTRPYSLGRRVAPEDLVDFADNARQLGLEPRLAEGWRLARV